LFVTVGLTSLGLIVLSSTAAAAPYWPVSALTVQARSIQWLFWLLMGIASIFLFGVIGMLLYCIIRFRGRPGQPDPPQRYGNLRLEFWWTIIPFAALVAVFTFTVRGVAEATAVGPDALDITVIGHQWWWEYHYPGNVVAANELHVPVGRQVRLTLRSADVVHNFWVPQLAGKEQTIPGQTNTWTFTPEQPGKYDGACSEYCGAQHGWMRLSVFADSPQDFDAWLAGQQRPPANLGSHPDGVQLFVNNACGGCHTIQGLSNGVAAPDLTHVGSRSTIGAGVLANTSDNMVRWLENPQDVKPGVLMPNFHLTNEQASQLAALLEDLR
jgi:cytochrome c oxidase subunit 2